MPIVGIGNFKNSYRWPFLGLSPTFSIFKPFQRIVFENPRLCNVKTDKVELWAGI
jgi:hypothetical protein